MTKKVKPFEPQEKGYTIVDNVVFDYILPELTANGWKVLCFIIRKTKGWHKEWDGLSYSQIMKGTGIKSSATVSKVLTELLDGDYIRQVKADDQFTAARYALNTALEIEVANGTTSENEADANSDSKLEPTSESEDTKQRVKQKETKGGTKAPSPPRDYLTDVFNGNLKLREGERMIQQADWDIRSPEHRQAIAAFLEASHLPVPPDKTRRDWMGSIDIHVKTYGASQLETMYPSVIAHMRGDGLTVSRPGSVTNNLADYWAKQKGDTDGTTRRGNDSTLTSQHREHAARFSGS